MLVETVQFTFNAGNCGILPSLRVWVKTYAVQPIGLGARRMEMAGGTDAKVSATPLSDAQVTLWGTDYTDVYSVDWPFDADASTLAQMALEPMPGWMVAALKTRDWIFSPFRLVPAIADRGEGVKSYGDMPVVTESSERVLVGYDDWHLDFRIALEVVQGRALARTFIARKHWFGYLYWLPTYQIHKRIVPMLLRRAVRRMGGRSTA